MKPYIEFEGNIYYFEANFKLKKEYDNEIKKLGLKSLEGLSTQEKSELEELQRLNKNITEEMLRNDEELRNKIFKYSNLISSVSYEQLYERYCYRMLKEKYPDMTEEKWEKMQEQFVEDYCEDIGELELLYSKVIEKVFTQVVEGKVKKPLPEWMR